MKYSYLTILKNTARSRSFIRELRKATKGRYKVVLRGRDKNRVAKAKKYNLTVNYCRDMPVKYADRIAVYLREIETKEEVLARINKHKPELFVR